MPKRATSAQTLKGFSAVPIAAFTVS